MRTPIPEDVAAQVLYQHDHTCCVCNEPGMAVQIHHIDENPSNHDIGNLAVLCLQDHEATQARGGFGRKLRASEVTIYRDEWLRRVKERREQADKIIVERLAGMRSQTANTGNAVEWTSPPIELLSAYIHALPDILRHTYAESRDLETADPQELVHALRLVTSVVEQSWVHLATWFAPDHFGGRPANEFFSRYRADRNLWHNALLDPEASGEKHRAAHRQCRSFQAAARRHCSNVHDGT